MAHSDGGYHVPLLVLPSGICPKHDVRWPGYPWLPCLPISMGLPVIHEHICPLRNFLDWPPWNCRRTNQSFLDALYPVLRVSLYPKTFLLLQFILDTNQQNRVGVPMADLPKFWSFMYRVSPATYLVGGIMSSAVANSNVTCADREILRTAPTGNLTCNEFLAAYMEAAGGLVLNPTARSMCEYCPLATTNEFLDWFQISYHTRWRDFGLIWVYILVNIVSGLGLYWVFKVPKRRCSKRAWGNFGPKVNLVCLPQNYYYYYFMCL